MKNKPIKENPFRNSKDLEILKAFTYKGIKGDIFLSLQIYDKKLKKVFAGNIGLSNWTREEIIKMEKDADNLNKKIKEL